MRRATHEDYEEGIYSENYPYLSGAERDRPWVLTGSVLLMALASGLLIGYWIAFHLIPWLVERGVG